MHQELHSHLHEPPATLEAALAQLAARDHLLAQLHAAHEGFLRAVAHDLRAPLRHLTSFAPLLRESVEQLAAAAPGEAAQEAQEFLGTMEHSARKMGLMLDALMHLSRAARQPLQVQAVDVRSVLATVAERVKPPQDIQAWALPDTPVLLHADPMALYTVLEAVVCNAVKFSAKQAEPRVQVRLAAVSPVLWRIEVADNGVGFDASRMDMSWPPFQRMHRENDFPGMGCGLAQAHVLAQRHGAVMQVASKAGMGCTVSLDWPAV